MITSSPAPVRLVVENRTPGPVTLEYALYPTYERGALTVPARGVGRFPAWPPRQMAWTNFAEIGLAKLPVEAADALDAAREPGAPPWEGLAFREESAEDETEAGLAVLQNRH